MSNVLPPADEKRLRHRFWARLIAAVAATAAATGALAFASLLPSYLTLRYRAQALLSPASSSVGSSTSAQAVFETRDLIQLSKQAAASSSATDLIRLAVSLRPAGVVLDSIGYIKNVSNPQVLLSGSAQRASEIQAYQTALSSSGRFSQVNVPVDSLAGTTNGRFSITLTGAM